MNVNVELSSYFRKYKKELKFEIDVKSGSSVGKILEQLEIPQEQIGFVAVNNKKVGYDHIISDNDNLCVFPFIVGG